MVLLEKKCMQQDSVLSLSSFNKRYKELHFVFCKVNVNLLLNHINFAVIKMCLMCIASLKGLGAECQYKFVLQSIVY